MAKKPDSTKLFDVRVVDHKDQRYPTVGDWIIENGKLTEIRVSDMGNTDYAFLVGVHEAIEAWLCLKRGITEESVSRFDKKFEKNRKPGNVAEPGNDPMAPYFNEHQFATHIEKMLAREMGIDWKKYSDVVDNL